MKARRSATKSKVRERRNKQDQEKKIKYTRAIGDENAKYEDEEY